MPRILTHARSQTIHPADCPCWDCSDDPILNRRRARQPCTRVWLAKARVDAVLLTLIAVTGLAAVISQFCPR
ncbi:hypothetical protein [Novosphingobium aquae]|uniref:Uncharacterized protein n=1 Tax=Novosphingobium aquae TaxID=3133435 RepID=A0ABU8S442_9SPHN